MRLILAILLLFLPMATAATAELAGHQAPGFLAARALWLEGDEAVALPALNGLAHQDNRAAQVLLGLIDKKPELQGPWLSGLSKSDRVSLMRTEGGISGQNWMRLAATDQPLAALWVSLWAVGAPVEVVTGFAAQGEARAAREALVTIAARGGTGLAAIGDDPGYPRHLRYFLWREWVGERALLPRLIAEVAALPADDPQLLLTGVPLADEVLEQWLMRAPEAAPLAELCRAQCPENPSSCAMAGYEAMGGLLPLLTLGSPVETLIPALEFAQSPRGQSAALRRIRLTLADRGRAMGADPVADSCLAAVLFDGGGTD